MEPVIAHPTIDHRAFGHGGLQRAVGVDLCHQRGETEVGTADNADLAIAFGHILHQPVDGVIGVGRLINAGGVQRPGDGAVHHEHPFRIVDAANVLINADIAIVHEFGVHHRQHLGQLLRGAAAGHAFRVIGGARQQDRAVMRAVVHQDHRIQLHPVAHRHHRHAANIVGIGPHRVIAGDDIGGHRREGGFALRVLGLGKAGGG